MLCLETGQTCERSDCFPYDKGGCWRGSLRRARASDSQEIVPSKEPSCSVKPDNGTDSAARKNIPLATGCFDYFPDALEAVAKLSKRGNDKHNPGEPLHWSRDKSTDHADCILRHMRDRGTWDLDNDCLHDVAVAWRALAQAQIALERLKGIKA